jgi:hypothetical protein
MVAQAGYETLPERAGFRHSGRIEKFVQVLTWRTKHRDLVRLELGNNEENSKQSVDGEQHSQSPAISPCRFGCRAERSGWHSRDSVWGFAVWHIRVLKKIPTIYVFGWLPFARDMSRV